MADDRRQRFAQEYLKSLNATEAAIAAGYSKKTAKSQGSRLLRDKTVKELIDAGKKQRSERAAISAEYVLKNLQEVAERCMERAPVLVREGRDLVQKVDEHERHVWEFDSSGANRSLELLGKHLKLFTEKVEHEHRFEDMTDEQLLARYQALLVDGGES